MGVGTMIGAFWGSVHGNLASQMGGLGGVSDWSIRELGFLWQPDQPGGGAPPELLFDEKGRELGLQDPICPADYKAGHLSHRVAILHTPLIVGMLTKRNPIMLNTKNVFKILFGRSASANIAFSCVF